MKTAIAYDLGTGGVKASLYNDKGQSLASTFVEYETFYPDHGLHEQRPMDWWEGIVTSTQHLLEGSEVESKDVVSIALSGHSLVTVPIDEKGNTLLDQVPIWSDTRAVAQTKQFFEKVDEETWYLATGNGFPAPCYSVFKLMWMKEHQPEVFARIHKVLGSKDYINFKLTGKVFTDHSYASGMGAYDLVKREMKAEILEAAGIPLEIFPKIVESSHVLGNLTEEVAEELGLTTETIVACGGVDNSCMALGACGGDEGSCYSSLGSSSWIAVNSTKPILDAKQRPYVFAHIEPKMYTSAFSIFSGGSSLRWVRDNICKDLDKEEAYLKMNEMATEAPIGSNGVLFNPSLAGGTSQDKSINIRGAFVNLSLGNTREELVRATMEGIALNLRMSLNNLKEHTSLSDEILFCGGGSKSPLWMQMFADIFEMTILKTNVDQEAASLGAAAIAFVAVGAWQDYSIIPGLHKVENLSKPNNEAVKAYQEIFKRFVFINGKMAEIGDYIYDD